MICLYKLIAFFLLSLAGCRHDEKPSASPTSDLQAEFQKRVERFDPGTITRCDSVTFEALFDAFGRRTDIYRFERSPGFWHRDTEDCYPKDSSSETSRDVYLGVLLSLHLRGDYDAIQRIYDYGKTVDWKMGEGPDGVANIWVLEPTISLMLEHKTLDGESDGIAAIAGFRGKLIGVYVLLRGLITGSLGPLELTAARTLATDQPDDPFFQALIHRFTDGDQTLAIYGLNHFPEGDNVFGWGSSPGDVYWILTYGTVFGK